MDFDNYVITYRWKCAFRAESYNFYYYNIQNYNILKSYPNAINLSEVKRPFSPLESKEHIVHMTRGVVGKDLMGGHSLIFLRQAFTFTSHDVITHTRSWYSFEISENFLNFWRWGGHVPPYPPTLDTFAYDHEWVRVLISIKENDWNKAMHLPFHATLWLFSVTRFRNDEGVARPGSSTSLESDLGSKKQRKSWDVR